MSAAPTSTWVPVQVQVATLPIQDDANGLGKVAEDGPSS